MKSIKILGTVTVVVAVLGLVLGSGLIAQDNSAKEQNRQTVQERAKTQTQLNDNGPGMGRGVNFVDEDGNGICDRFEQNGSMRQNINRGMGHGQHFIDENGDGMCDNRSSGRMHNGRGHGNGGNQRGSMNRGSRH